MTAGTFLAKSEALMKKGPMALFSGDVGVLKKELRTASTQLRAARLAVVKAGGKPAYCPPDKGSMNSNELLAHLRAIPQAQRGMSFKAALGGLLVKKYPCSA